MSITLITAPASEPVDLDFAKAFLRVDHDHEDALITQMLLAARLQVESLIGKRLMSQRVSRRFDIQSPPCLHLTLGPVQELHRLRLVGGSGGSSSSGGSGGPLTIASKNYTVNLRCDPAQISLKSGLSWAQFLPDATHIDAEFSCGYGEDGLDVPAPLRQAILLLCAQYYERGEAGEKMPVPMLVQALLMPYRGLRL